MTRKLHLAEHVTFPIDTVTQTLLVLGGKGMGKTNFGGVLAEELHAHKQRFAVLDPMGVWHGLQYSADGKGEGLDVLILGGKHADIPITPLAGAVVADLVADEAVSCVIDISRHPDGKMWSRGDRIRFVTAYVQRLYERQGEKRRPLMQIIDECARFAPQQAMKNDNDVMACLGALSQLVEEGRNVGVGVCLITQRSARLNKAVAELAECMVAFRTIGPNSVDAILDWFGSHVSKSRWNELEEILRKLPVGEALIVSPGWLGYEQQDKIRLRHTFDSSATPTGDERRAPGRARKPDLDKYKARMAETIEQAKLADPRELRKRVQELEKENKHLARVAESAPRETREKTVTKEKLVPQPVLRNRESDRLYNVWLKIDKTVEKLEELLQDATEIKTEIIGKLETALSQSIAREEERAKPKLHVVQAPKLTPFVPKLAPAERKAVEAAAAANGDFKITKPMQRLLDAMLWWENVGVAVPTRAQAGLIAKVNYSGGYFDQQAGPLAAAGYIERGSGTVRLLDVGRAYAVAPPKIDDLQQYLNVLRAQIKASPTLRIFQAIICFVSDRGFPIMLTRDELGEASQVNYTGGYFDQAIRPLATMGLVDRRGGKIVPTELMFPRSLT